MSPERSRPATQRVYECLNAISVRVDGTTAAVESRYTYDGRTVVWADMVDLADPTDVGAQMGGELVAATMQGFEMLRSRSHRGLTPIEIAEAVGCDFVVPVVPRPPRNAPCPCGSGRKAKLCCWG